MSEHTNNYTRRILHLLPHPALLVCLISILLLIASCNGTSGSSGPDDRNLLTLRLVHDPSLSPFMQGFKTNFEASKPKLSNGASISIELIPDSDVHAANSIASGAIKTEAWLAPSSSLVEYTNSSLSNLGPKQVNCLGLFSTPIVLGTLQKNQDFFGAQDGSFSWNEFFEAKVATPVGTAISLSHSSPASSPSGLASLIQLAYLANNRKDQTLSLDELKSPKNWAKLKLFESSVSNYGAIDEYLLERAHSTIASRVRFVFTSEQALASYNASQEESKRDLVALYPSEGSTWLDYQLCTSDADWVTPAHRAALKLFTDFLSSEPSQLVLKRLGYRPTLVQFEEVAPLTKSNGINTLLPKLSFNPAPAPVLSHLLKNWPSLSKPSAFALVVDTSGSMEGDSLYYAKDAFRRIIAHMTDRDMSAIISVSSEPSVDLPWTADRKKAIQSIDPLRAAGGSALYDSLKEGILLLGNDKVKDFRKTVLLVTDGGDINSQTPLQRFVDFAAERAATLDLNLIIVAIKNSDADYSDMKKIAKAARGSFIEVDASNLPQTLENISLSL